MWGIVATYPNNWKQEAARHLVQQGGISSYLSFSTITSLMTQTTKVSGFLRKSQGIWQKQSRSSSLQWKPRYQLHVACLCKISQQCCNCCSLSTGTNIWCAAYSSAQHSLYLRQGTISCLTVCRTNSTKHESEVGNISSLSTTALLCKAHKAGCSTLWHKHVTCKLNTRACTHLTGI